jgi:RND family efflux transporter MFP subunit
VTESLDAQLAALRVDRTAEPPRRGRALVWTSIAVSAAAAAAGTVWFATRDGSADPAPVRATAPAAPTAPRSAAELTATGYLVAKRSSEIAAPVSALVETVLVGEGDLVRAGDPIAVLDARDAEAALAAARARTVAANARIAALEARRRAADRTLDRERRLAEAGVATKVAVEDRESSLEEISAEVDAARAEVRASRADAEALEVSLGRFRVTAPFDGLVTSAPAAPGEVASPGATLVVLDDLGSLVVEVDVPEARLAIVRVGAACEVVFDALPEATIRGEVVRGPSRVDRSKATATIAVRLIDAPSELRPGMAARVRFLAS